MANPSVQLAFFKLNVSDMEAMLKFYDEAFGFAVTMSFDEPAFIEHMLALPGQEQGPNLLLVAYKDGRDVTVGTGHGPVGLQTDDIEALFARALSAGATPTMEIFEAGGVRIAMLLDPEGHEVELVQFPAA